MTDIILNIDTDKEEIARRITDMISDDEIERYLGKEGYKKIIKYNQLKNYKSIDHLLPKINDYKIILIESQENSGHWILILKYKNKEKKTIIEYYNSYGMKPEADLNYIGNTMNKLLGNNKDDLNNLLDNAISKGYEVIYNKKRFQSSNKKVNTCGRHVINRIIMNKKFKMDLYEYIDFIEELKKRYDTEADVVIALLMP